MRRIRTKLRQSSFARALLWPLTSSYGRMWDLAAMGKDNARWWMAGTKSDEQFEESGRHDAQQLGRFVAQDSRVLDLGCGIGRVMLYLAPRCAELYGVDVSSRMLGRARARLRDVPNAQLSRVSGRDLRVLPDDYFDFAYSLQVLQHVEREDVMRYFAELMRVLRPGGRAYLQFLNLEVEALGSEFYEYALESELLQAARRRYFTEAEVRAYAALAGFDGTYLWTDRDWLFLLAAKPAGVPEPERAGEYA
ncbi:MAG: class I SAM-dependent methyltransferase [Dehalococcoidia bacterium]